MSARRVLFAVLAATPLAFALSAAHAAPPAGVHLERLVPEKTLAFASVEDVGLLGEKAKGTAIAKLFADPEMKAFFAPIGEDLRKMMEQPHGGGPGAHSPFAMPPIAGEAIKALAGLRGQVSIALVDVDKETGPAVAGCLDFGEHLSDFVTFLTRLASEHGPDAPPISMETRDGRPWWSLSMGGPGSRPAVSATTVGTAVLISTDATWLAAVSKGDDVPSSLGASEAFKASRSGAGGDALAVLVHANVPAILAKVSPPPKAMKAITALGIDAIRSAAYGIAIKGDGFLESLVVDAPKADHGIFTLLPLKPTSHKLLALAPSTAFLYAENTAEFTGFGKRLRDIAGAIDPKVPAQIDDVLKSVREKVGVDVETEILGALAGENALWAAFPETGGLYPEIALVLGVKDAKAFEETFERLVRGIVDQVNRTEKVTAAMRTLEYRGQRLHLVDLASVRKDVVPFTPTWTILGDRLVVTLVPHAMKEIVLRSQAGTEGGGGLAAQEDVKSLLAAGPEGHGAFEYIDLQGILSLVYDTAVPLLQTVAKPNVIPVPVHLDWALLPAARTVRPYLRSLAEFASIDDKGIRVSVHGPIPMVLPAIILASVAVPMVAGRAAHKARAIEEATRAGREAASFDSTSLLEVAALVQRYAAEHQGKLPGKIDDLGADVPKDPWGKAFELHTYDDGRFEVRSSGPDGVWGTEDDLLHEGKVVMPK